MKSKTLPLGLLVATLFLLCACSSGVNGEPQPHPEPKNSIEAGRQWIASYGCGACHSIPGVPGAHAKAGPPLDRFYERSYIAGHLPNTEENLIKWIQDPQGIDPGNAMPNLGVTHDQARDIAAYLYHQPTLSDLINR
jgi:cytochrome c